MARRGRLLDAVAAGLTAVVLAWVMPASAAGGNAPAAAPAAAPVAPTPGDFAAFLAGVRAEAAAKGIGPAGTRALDGLHPLDRVVALDRKQPEFTLTFAQYLAHVVSPRKVAEGRKMMAENRALLARIHRRYGVQPRFVVALWGIESDYGRLMGTFPIVGSLATLAWDGRRSAYFRGELLDALRILDQGHVQPDAMIGSWAGAMGQCQFMPSTFLKYAQDFDGDGRRDLWSDRADVLASAANYLSHLGWKGDETWGRAVRLPRRFPARLIGLDTRKSLAEWRRLGVRTADGRPVPRRRDMQASLVRAEGDHGPVFLVYDNFRAVMKWNRSTFFALAAGHLADKIAHR